MTLYVAKSKELVELVVLGLLCEQPRHPYDMQRQLKMRGNTSFVRGLPRSLYTAVESLVEGGYVRAGDTSRDGTRPEKTTFAITERGREAYVARLTWLLATPSDQPTFHAALSLVAGLTPEQTVTSLRARLDAIARELEDNTLDEALKTLPRLVLIEVEYLRSQIAAEAAWVETIIAEAESGSLSWNLKFGPGANGPAKR